MHVSISEAAALHYQKEMGMQAGDYLRLFVRVGGVGSGGFSIGVSRELPEDTAYILEKSGIQFFVNPQDQWYIDGMDITYDETIDYLNFSNPRMENTAHPE